eukprot:1866954-Alexandrium_andersonii.AAC.1
MSPAPAAPPGADLPGSTGHGAGPPRVDGVVPTAGPAGGAVPGSSAGQATGWLAVLPPGASAGLAPMPADGPRD